GRPARRRELPAERPRRGGLGHSDGPPRAPGSRGWQAGGALSSRAHVETRRTDQVRATEQQEKREPMKAVTFDRYGPPEVLHIEDVARPVPKEDEVLVRVHASTVTRGDAMGVRSVEYRFSRLFTGIRRPRRTIFGSEFAGRVEEVGAGVTEFRV